MNEPEKDRLEVWSARLADGELIDWDAARQALPSAEFLRLKQLAELAGTMRRCSSSDRLIGERWGHLEIRELLGRGSFGEVMLAFDPILQREVALKLRRIDAPDARPEAWIREARQLARVRHPNVLAVHGADTHGGVPGLWADRVEGQTLRKRILESVPDPEERLRIAQQLAAAVRAVHAEGLVHGDIKPANVMFESSSGRVILMDFGTAQDADDAETSSSSTGTPMYMAPERLDGGPATVDADIFALGATLAFLTTGRTSFHVESIDDLRALHGMGTGPDLDGASVPRALRRLIIDMLDPNPGRRPAIDVVVARLERIRTAPARRRRTTALGSIFTLLMAGLAVSVTAYLRVSNAESETAAVNDFLREVLAAPRATELGRDTRIVDVLERAIPEAELRFADRPQAMARVQALTGRTFESLGEFDQAEPLLRQALAMFREQFGDSDPRSYLVRDSIARIERSTGRVDAAEATWDHLYRIADRSTPAGREAMILVHTGRARIHMDAAQTDAALDQLDQALALHSDSHTEGAAERARTLKGLVLVQAGRLEEAAGVARSSLEESLRLHGVRHSSTLIARDRLIQVHYGRGDLDRAETLARENLQVAEAWLGTFDRLTVMTQISLSNVLADLGRLEDALALLDSAAEGASEVFDSDELDPLAIDGNRAARLLELGRYEQSAALSAELVERIESTQAPVGGLRWINGLNLAEAWYWMGKLPESLQQSQQMNDELIAAFGDGHPLARIAQSYMAAVHNRVGDLGLAAELLDEAEPGLTRTLGPDHPQVLLIQVWQLENRTRAGDFDLAQEEFELLLERAERVLGADHYRLRDMRRIVDIASPGS